MANTVLIADDDNALRQALALRCKQMGLEVIECATGLQALQDIVQLRPDLMILDVGLPGADGLSLLEQLQKNHDIPPVPAIFLTGRSDEQTIERCKHLGAPYVWKGLQTWDALQPLVCQLLHRDPTGEPIDTQPSVDPSPEESTGKPRPPRVLVIDDDPAVSKAIQIRLAAHGIEVLRAFNGMQGYWMALKERPDLVVTDYRMPEGRANTVIGRMKDHPLTRNTPIIVLTGWQVSNGRDCGLERDLRLIGADEYLQKPIDWEELFAALRNYIQIPERSPAPAC